MTIDEKLIELLKQAQYFAYQFECMAPLYLALTQPHSSIEAQKAAYAVWKDVDSAKELREKLSDYLKENKIEIS